MRQLADFMVEKRIWLLAIFLLLAVGSVFLIPKVEINTDMSKYLPDDSEMKQGKDLMGEQMPETLKVQSSLRVMFDDLPDEEKSEMKNRLAGIAGVASVTWQPESEYYNKDNHTLYILKSDSDYRSDTYLEIEETLEKEYASSYKVIWHNDDTNSN